MSHAKAEPAGSTMRLALPLAALLSLAGCALLLGIVAPQCLAADNLQQRLWTRCDGRPGDFDCDRASLPVVAADPAGGYVYATFSLNSPADRSIIQYTAWGEFVKKIGWGVADGSEELQTCTEFDACQPGILGTGAGQFRTLNLSHLAADSEGDLWVAEGAAANRVQKFDADGHFLLMVGGEVNKTKVAQRKAQEAASEPVTVTEAEENLCTAASGDQCGAGVSGSGPGELTDGNTNIAVGVSDRLFVGGTGRIQVLNSDGSFREKLPDPEGLLAGKSVAALAAGTSPTEPSIFVSLRSGSKLADSVLKLSESGTRRCTARVSGSSFQPREIAADNRSSPHLIVFDGSRNVVSEFDSDCVFAVGYFEGNRLEGSAEELDGVGSLALGSGCFAKAGEFDLYFGKAGTEFSGTKLSRTVVRAYGEPPTETAGACQRPTTPPEIFSQYALSAASFSAHLGARVVPHFYATSYYAQYGTAACLESEAGWESPCVRRQPVAAPAELGGRTGEPIATDPVAIEGLEPDTDYRFRFVASNEIGTVAGEGGTLSAEGVAGSFRTFRAPGPPPGGCGNDAFRAGPATQLPDCRAYEMVSPIDKEGADIVALTYADGTPLTALAQADREGRRFTYSTATRFCDAVGQPYGVQYLATRHSRGSAGEGWSCHGIVARQGTNESLLPVNEFQAFSEDLCSAWLVNTETSEPPLAPGAREGAPNLYERTNCGDEGYQTAYPANLLKRGAPILNGTAPGGLRLISTPLAGAGSLLIGTPAQLTAEEGAAVCWLPDNTEYRFACSAGLQGGSHPAVESSVHNAISSDGTRVYWSAEQPEQTGTVYLRLNPTQQQSQMEHGAATGRGNLVKDSVEVTNVGTETGAFQAGQSIVAGRGIVSGTTIEAVGPETLTLSQPATESRSSQSLSAYSRCSEPSRACTVPVSDTASTEGLPQYTSQRSIYWGAAADGFAALFSFDPDTTPFGGGPAKDDLYRFDAETRSSTLIARDVLGVLGYSEDLSKIYLVSEDVLAGESAEERSPVPGDPNLYLFRQGGGFEFVATLAAADARNRADFANPSAVSVNPGGRRARVSPSGDIAAFVSYASLTGYDNTDLNNGLAGSEVFRYDARTARLACVSCDPSGARPSGRKLLSGEGRSFNLSSVAKISAGGSSLYAPRSLSEDGGRLFFESYDGLLPRDTNEALDVYQWEVPGEGSCATAAADYIAASGGCLGLISSGKSSRDSQFMDATPSGDDVFFRTEQSLLDKDPGLVDVYDARVDGGFPEPRLTPPCEGEACQSPSAPPTAVTPGSASYTGPGNLTAAGQRGCARRARSARRLAHLAQRLRRHAKRAGSARGSARLRRSARRRAVRARKLSRSARRCRRAGRNPRTAR